MVLTLGDGKKEMNGRHGCEGNSDRFRYVGRAHFKLREPPQSVS